MSEKIFGIENWDWADWAVNNMMLLTYGGDHLRVAAALRKARADGMREAADLAATGNGRVMGRSTTDFEFGKLAAELYAAADKLEHPGRDGP